MLSTNLGASPQLECWNNRMAARKGLMKKYQDQDIELIHQTGGAIIEENRCFEKQYSRVFLGIKNIYTTTHGRAKPV